MEPVDVTRAETFSKREQTLHLGVGGDVDVKPAGFIAIGFTEARDCESPGGRFGTYQVVLLPIVFKQTCVPATKVEKTSLPVAVY